MHTGESSATTPGAWASSWTTGTRLATWSQPTSGTPPAPPRQTWFLSGQGSASPCSGTPSQSGCASPPDLPIYLEWGTRPTFLSSALRGMSARRWWKLSESTPSRSRIAPACGTRSVTTAGGPPGLKSPASPGARARRRGCRRLWRRRLRAEGRRSDRVLGEGCRQLHRGHGRARRVAGDLRGRGCAPIRLARSPAPRRRIGLPISGN
jgi:hypothetical protein